MRCDPFHACHLRAVFTRELAGRRFEELQKQLPFICTASTKANCAKRYPSEILAGLLYLGDWANAEATDRFGDLNIRRCRLFTTACWLILLCTSRLHTAAEAPASAASTDSRSPIILDFDL